MDRLQLRSESMPGIVESIDVVAPVRVAYNQWLRFEEFPRFLDGVERVVRRGDTLDWTADLGRPNQWTAEIVEETPDVRLAWHRLSGEEIRSTAWVTPWSSGQRAGAVLFQSVHPNQTQVTLELHIESDEEVGVNYAGLYESVRRDLERFKQLIESRGGPTTASSGAERSDPLHPVAQAKGI
jgi:uncharacterized membrane protein